MKGVSELTCKQCKITKPLDAYRNAKYANKNNINCFVCLECTHKPRNLIIPPGVKGITYDQIIKGVFEIKDRNALDNVHEKIKDKYIPCYIGFPTWGQNSPGFRN